MSSEASSPGNPLLDIRGLSLGIEAVDPPATILKEIDLCLKAGESHGLVGESGSGKTTLARTLLRLQNRPVFRIKGEISFQGRDLLGLPQREMRGLRGPAIAYLPQDAQSSLNPHQRISSQFLELLSVHTGLSPDQRKQRARESLREVGLSDDLEILQAYPHQVSVGMAQRVLIAMALSLQPALLVADEPTSSLDIVSSARVTDLLADLNKRNGLAILLITHDFEVLFKVTQQVSVLYGGEIVEQGPMEVLRSNPSHPYTRALLSARMIPGRRSEAIAGEPPEPQHRPPGCVFHPRCPEFEAPCSQQRPGKTTLEDGRLVRCLRREGKRS